MSSQPLKWDLGSDFCVQDKYNFYIRAINLLPWLRAGEWQSMNSTALTSLTKFVNHNSKQVSLRSPQTALVKVDTRAAVPSAKQIKWHPQQNFSSFIISAFLESPHNPAHPSPQGYRYQVIRQQNIVTFYNITLKYKSSQQDSAGGYWFWTTDTADSISSAGEMPKVKCLLKIHIWLQEFH